MLEFFTAYTNDHKAAITQLLLCDFSSLVFVGWFERVFREKFVFSRFKEFMDCEVSL